MITPQQKNASRGKGGATGSGRRNASSTTPNDTQNFDSPNENHETENDRDFRGGERGADEGQSRELASADWISEFSEGAQALEQGIESLIRERPLAVFGAAVGIGLAGYFLTKRTGAFERSNEDRNTGG